MTPISRYLDLLESPDGDQEDEDGDDNTPATGGAGAGGDEGGAVAQTAIDKVEPGPADEIREVIVRRKREEVERQREERLRREAYQADLDRKVRSNYFNDFTFF